MAKQPGSPEGNIYHFEGKHPLTENEVMLIKYKNELAMLDTADAKLVQEREGQKGTPMWAVLTQTLDANNARRGFLHAQIKTLEEGTEPTAH